MNLENEISSKKFRARRLFDVRLLSALIVGFLLFVTWLLLNAQPAWWLWIYAFFFALWFVKVMLTKCPECYAYWYTGAFTGRNGFLMFMFVPQTSCPKCGFRG